MTHITANCFNGEIISISFFLSSKLWWCAIHYKWSGFDTYTQNSLSTSFRPAYGLCLFTNEFSRPEIGHFKCWIMNVCIECYILFKCIVTDVFLLWESIVICPVRALFLTANTQPTNEFFLTLNEFQLFACSTSNFHQMFTYHFWPLRAYVRQHRHIITTQFPVIPRQCIHHLHNIQSYPSKVNRSIRIQCPVCTTKAHTVCIHLAKCQVQVSTKCCRLIITIETTTLIWI